MLGVDVVVVVQVTSHVKNNKTWNPIDLRQIEEV